MRNHLASLYERLRLKVSWSRFRRDSPNAMDSDEALPDSKVGF